MDNKLLLVKAITLLFRESLNADSGGNSADLVKNLLNFVNVSDVSLGINSDKEIIIGLRGTAREMANNPHNYAYDKETLLQQLRMNTMQDDKLFEVFKRTIDEEYNESNNKRAITNLIKDLNNFFVEEQIGSILSKASYNFRANRSQIKDTNQFVAELVGQLEPLQTNVKIKDPAIVGDLDLGDGEAVSGVFNEVKSSIDSGYVMTTGWQALNRMLQGGIRRGECGVIGALQHNYKTGFTVSIFKQLAIYNKPFMIDPKKKPMMLRISFEDDLTNNLQFMYQQLKTDETDEVQDISLVNTDEASSYVKERMEINGYAIRMLRVDPTNWTYRNICNKVTEFEAQGYEIHVLMLDYLGMVPTTGCINSGPAGTDVRDMFRRMRNFCAPKKIALITPHQLSTEAKGLIRAGIPEESFVKEVANKGYYAGTRQLDQEVDWEIYIHIAKEKRRSFLTVQRGKHRLPTIISEEDKYFILPFPKKRPIPDDLFRDDSSMKRIQTGIDDSQIGTDITVSELGF